MTVSIAGRKIEGKKIPPPASPRSHAPAWERGDKKRPRVVAGVFASSLLILRLCPNRHLLRFDGFRFRQMYGQNAVLVFRFDLARVDGFMHLKDAIKIADVVLAEDQIAFRLARRDLAAQD